MTHNNSNNGLKVLIFCFCILLAFWPKQASSQEYIGTWEGNYENTSGWIQPDRIVLELYAENDSIFGASHLYYSRNRYEHYNLKGFFNPRDQTVTVQEVSELKVKLGFLQKNYAGTYNLKLQCKEPECSLFGTWKVKRGPIFVKKTINAYFFKPFTPSINKAKSTGSTGPAAPQPDSKLQRQTDIQSLIEIKPDVSDTIHIQVYDNGEIDGDTVSVYLDDLLLVDKQKISAQAIEINLPVSNLKSISKLKLVAESIGSIPPRTAVMVVTIGKKRYELSLSSDFTKNGVVEFFLKE